MFAPASITFLVDMRKQHSRGSTWLWNYRISALPHTLGLTIHSCCCCRASCSLRTSWRRPCTASTATSCLAQRPKTQPLCLRPPQHASQQSAQCSGWSRSSSLLTGPPSPLLLEAPTGAARAEAVTTAVVVFIVNDLRTRTARATAYPGPLLLTAPAPCLLLTGPPPVLLLEAAPRLLLLPAPTAASPPANATPAVMVIIVKCTGATKRRQTACATAQLLHLTGPPRVLLLSWPPRRLLLPAPLTAAPPTSIMTSVAVPASMRKDLAPWAARMMMRLQLPAEPPIRPIEPHPRLLLQAHSAATLPPTITTNFAMRPSPREDGTKQPTSMTARRLLLTWPTSVQPVSAPGPGLLTVRKSSS